MIGKNAKQNGSSSQYNRHTNHQNHCMNER